MTRANDKALRAVVRGILNEMHPGGEGITSWSGETRRVPMISPHNDAQKLISFVDHNPGAIGGDLEMAISSSKHDPIPLIRMLRHLIGMDNLKGSNDEYWAEIISRETGGSYSKPQRDPFDFR